MRLQWNRTLVISWNRVANVCTMLNLLAYSPSGLDPELHNKSPVGSSQRVAGQQYSDPREMVEVRHPRVHKLDSVDPDEGDHWFL